MNHFSQEQWIAYLYEEDEGSTEMKAHLQRCRECAAFARELAADRSFLDSSRFAADVLACNADYGERTWDSLAGRLTPYPAKPRGFFVSWKLAFGLGLAGAAVALAIVAFYSGRLWEKKQSSEAAVADHNPATAQGRENVILLVLDDHLDRSQRLLAELDDADSAAKDPELRKTARELLAANRLYRAAAGRVPATGISSKEAGVDDDSLQMMLDDLEPVLVELANQPAAPDRREIVRLRDRMRTNGLLFEIHMLRSQVRLVQPEQVAVRREGKI